MTENFNLFVDLVLDAEGGLSNDPSDMGGLTNRGITVATFKEYLNDVEDRDYPCGMEEASERLYDLTEQDAILIYEHYYWNEIRADDLPNGIDVLLADFAVNSGVRTAVTVLQEMLAVSMDGILGPKTLAALSKKDPKAFTNKLLQRRLQYYFQVAQLNENAKFHRGWNNRVIHIYNELIKANLC